jgi:hypothetical protein
MVNAPKKDLSLLPAGKSSTQTWESTPGHHPANTGISHIKKEKVRTLAVLRNL